MEAYFRGKTIELVVGFSPGGGFDTYTRLFAQHAPRHFPGSPQFIVTNLPGAGGQRGLQEILRSTPDGLTSGVLHSRFVKREISGEDVPDFDLTTVVIVGAPDFARTYEGLYVRRSVATSWQEVLDSGRTLTLGATEPGGGPEAGAALIEALGGPVRTIYGYGGTSEVHAALDRGELDGLMTGSEATVMRLYPEWIEEQYILPIIWWTEPIPESYLAKLGAPEPIHLYDAMPLTDEHKTVFEVTSGVSRLNRTFVLPPGTPEDIHQAWTAALEATVSDPQFVEAATAAGFDPTFGSPEEVQQIIQSAMGLSPEGRELFAQLAGSE